MPTVTAASNKGRFSWYLVHSKPRQENTALVNLERQGYVCYLPLLRVEKIRRGKIETGIEPLFPRYLFIQLGSDSTAKSWTPIRSTLGVSKLVYFGKEAARVDETLIDLLRREEAAGAVQTLLAPGDPVAILEGPFAGISAIFQTADAEKRAIVLLEMLSKTVILAISPSALRKVD